MGERVLALIPDILLKKGGLGYEYVIKSATSHPQTIQG